ncbi:hypothetical protein LSUE1_G003560 [Lachnellula suecica]|uniref:Zn(2)-C6 fungal-type domain-containing protein n=1 Tax=Lachnellula suecica TaxID=602035 RepID=A0A8T9CCL7_9HELO|nr:hypothetical protein LSUE1_G003560 [Lachnellula suecica]
MVNTGKVSQNTATVYLFCSPFLYSYVVDLIFPIPSFLLAFDRMLYVSSSTNQGMETFVELSTARINDTDCDEGKPGCMRCQKSKRVCPGYRDTFELNLRDQTSSTRKRMNRMLKPPSSYNPIQDSTNRGQINDLKIVTTNYSSNDTDSSTWSSGRSSTRGSFSSMSSFGTTPSPEVTKFHQHSGSLCPQLSTPIDQQAACFFLANFVLLPAKNTMRGYLDFLLPHLRKANPDSCLSAAFTAVAMASLGTRPNSKSLLPQADLCYVKALNEINLALKDPKMASSDSGLGAVLLLSFFEQITAPRLNHQAWNSHVDGAVALLKARGPKAFQNPTGREVWHTVRATYTIQRIANSTAIEPSADWWMAVPPTDKIIQVFAELNLKIAELKYDAEKTTILFARTPTNYEKILALLRRAEQLEVESRTWFESLPLSWEARSEAWCDDMGIDYSTSEVHPGRIDSYSEMWIAYHQNIARATRILVWSTILRCVAWLGGGQKDYRLSPEYARAQQACRPLIEDVVASCPYFFGWNKDKNEAMGDKSFFACGTQDTGSVKCLWGIFVMWPLFVASSSDFSSPSQKGYLRGRLQYISGTMGIYQASVLLNAPRAFPSMYIMRDMRSMQAHTQAQANANAQISTSTSPPNSFKPGLREPTLAPRTWGVQIINPPQSDSNTGAEC